MSMTRVKICGLTRVEDALLAQSLGAWALGFIFYAKSPRAVTPLQAAKIVTVLDGPALKVGVFVNPTLEELVETMKICGLTAIQLHGHENEAFCGEVKKQFQNVTLIKARRLDEPSAKIFSDFELIDHATADAWGGTGSRVDSNQAASVRHDRMILAGGLNPENIEEAIQKVKPFAVDVSSGVEESHGVKSEMKMRAFFDAVKRSHS